jgi:hypothetical protein
VGHTDTHTHSPDIEDPQHFVLCVLKKLLDFPGMNVTNLGIGYQTTEEYLRRGGYDDVADLLKNRIGTIAL